MQKGYYRSKPVSVEAFQWDGVGDPGDPSGLALAIQFGVEPNKLRIVAERLQVVTAAGTAMASPGDWIVFWKNTTKVFEIFSDAEFRRSFEIDQRPARVRGWREQSGK
jgi:hypothetical protein